MRSLTTFKMCIYLFRLLYGHYCLFSGFFLPFIFIFVPAKCFGLCLPVHVLIKAAETYCMDEPTFGLSPAVVWMLNAL